MISLVGGELYQWDTGRIVRVVPDENVKVHEVHFSTKRMDYAYVLKTYIVDGVTYCAIPNIILQQSNRLLCYEVCENSDGEETIANTYFDIIKRNRPEDYVYTEQDHFTIQALSNRVDKLEESSHTHINKTELDTITKEDLETWRSPNSSAITGGAQVGTLFEDLEVTTTLAEDASEWTSASSQPFKCTFRPSPGQMVVVKVKDLDVDTITTAKIPPTGYPLGQTIIGNYSVVNSRLKSWYNDADSVPPTPNDAQANSCLVFEDQYYDSEHLTPSLPTCILYTKTPGTYKVTVTTLKHSIGPESVVKMYDVRPSTFAEYGTYTNWKDLTKSGKYDLWEVSIKKTNYYNGVYLKEVNGTKYIYVYRSEQKKDPENGIFTTTDYTLTYDTATETVTCSDATINPETDVIISVHLDQVISTVPDNATSLGKPSADKVGKMLTTVDLGEGVIDNKWQSHRYEYQWVDAQPDWDQNDTTAKDYIKNRICYEEEIVTELGNTAEVWHNLTDGLSSTPISYRMNGKIYKDLTAENGGGNDRIIYNGSVPEAYLLVVNYSSDVSQIRLNYPSNVTDFQFVKIENTVKQIDPKFIPIAKPDWDQNDTTAKDYVKNRTHYTASEYYKAYYNIRLSTAGNTETISVHPTIPFILGEEVHIFDEFLKQELTYEAPYIVKEDENGELYVGTSPFRIYRNKIRSLNSWVQQSGLSVISVQKESAFKPGKQLDPKFIPEMYYTEENITELGNTYKDWLAASEDDNGNYVYKPLSFLFDGQIYKDIIPKADSSDFIIYNLSSDGKRIVIYRNAEIFETIPENTPFQIIKVNDNPTIHKIPSKYIDIPQLFIITPTYNADTKTWSTDRTWDEVKAALTKSENPNDYAISLDMSLLSPNDLAVSRNSSGEITNVQMRWIITNPMVVDKDMMPDGFGSGLVPMNNYVNIKYNAGSSDIKFTYMDSGEILQAIINYALISKSDDGTLVCDPPNAVNLFGGVLTSEDSTKAQFICPLYYNGETYHYESFEKDSSNIVSLYFSTVSNGIYKRLKITQGQNGAADTVVMDKEIELAGSINNIMFRGEVANGTIYRDSSIDFRIEDQDTYSKRAFDYLCQGTRNAYLKLYGENTSEYELEPGGFADGIYSLKYNGKDALRHNIRGAYSSIGFDGDIYDIIKNDSKITGYELLADQISYSAIPRNDIETDGTTIKFNDQGQLALALSNANGVSF